MFFPSFVFNISSIKEPSFLQGGKTSQDEPKRNSISINCSLTWGTPGNRGLFSHPLWSFCWFAWRFTLTWQHFLFSSMSGTFTEDYLDNLIPECCLEKWSPVEELYFLLQLSNSVVIVPGGGILQISAFFLFSNFRKRQIALYSPCRLVGRSVGRLVDVTINFFNI